MTKLNIKMKNAPRVSNKTTKLKLMVFEEYHKGNYDSIFLLGHSSNSDRELMKWAMNNKIQL